jgi:hypothetical protein
MDKLLSTKTLKEEYCEEEYHAVSKKNHHLSILCGI